MTVVILDNDFTSSTSGELVKPLSSLCHNKNHVCFFWTVIFCFFLDRSWNVQPIVVWRWIWSCKDFFWRFIFSPRDERKKPCDETSKQITVMKLANTSIPLAIMKVLRAWPWPSTCLLLSSPSSVPSVDGVWMVDVSGIPNLESLHRTSICLLPPHYALSKY